MTNESKPAPVLMLKRGESASCIRMLERYLELARHGEVVAIALVGLTPEGVEMAGTASEFIDGQLTMIGALRVLTLDLERQEQKRLNVTRY